MEYKNLGKAGIKVSTIALGTLNFGTSVAEADAINIIHAAVDSGINFIDTANLYGKVDFLSSDDFTGVGRAEEITGKALKGIRHSVVLATKAEPQVGPGINDRGLSRRHLMQSVESSLRRLQTDHVDVFYAHAPDYSTPIEETLRALDDMVHQGKVRYIGLSNYRAWQLCKALWTSDKCNLARFDCIEIAYNLIARSPEYELLPLCLEEGVGITVWAPLAGVLLSGKYIGYDPSQPPPSGTRAYPGLWKQENFEAVARLNQVAEASGCSLSRFSLAWLLHADAVTSVICGVSSKKQLEDNLAAVEIKLSKEDLAACDEVLEKLCPTPNMRYGWL